MISEKYDIEPVLNTARERIKTLAEDYREKVLIPFCRKHRLTFHSGMGRTVFYTRDGRNFGSAEDAVYEGYPQAKPIFEVLDQEAVGRNDEFGFYVVEVTEEDVRARRAKR